MGEEDLNITPQTPEDDPLFLTKPESNRLEQLEDAHGHIRALEMVLGGGERYRRYVAAEVRDRMQRTSDEAAESRRREEADQAARSDENALRLLTGTDSNSPSPEPSDTDKPDNKAA